MKINKPFDQYKNSINSVLSSIDEDQLDGSINIINKTIKKRGRIYIVGNGGSSSIASHVSVDFAKVSKVPSSTFNNTNLITCFANDYGYENWLAKALEYYSVKDDLVILVSSSGKSPNIIKAAQRTKELKLKLVTLTGFDKNNPLKKLGDLNLWVDSRAYNIIENTHLIWLLAVNDLIFGNAEYTA